MVNVTNDGYFPNSMLPKQHFDHGVLRAVENGIPIIRSCNTGITGAVDSFGRVIKLLATENGDTEKIAETLHVIVPILEYPTLYTFWGDAFILEICILSVLLQLGICVSDVRENILLHKKEVRDNFL